jgi:hypothetical protein
VGQFQSLADSVAAPFSRRDALPKEPFGLAMGARFVRRRNACGYRSKQNQTGLLLKRLIRKFKTCLIHAGMKAQSEY